MPCYHPMQASFSVLPDGKKKLRFNSQLAADAAQAFVHGYKLNSTNIISLPCGKCMGCRLEHSRQWATRIMHEAQMHENNCFITLTYSDEYLPKDGSLNKKHFQDFMKRLRQEFSDVRIRYYQCGEYGDNFSRPHYHACIFGLDFPDKRFYKGTGEFKLYTSAILEKVWGMGHCPIGSLTFDSAGYVARYCTKKVNGDKAEAHYQGRQPEYSTMSRGSGIGTKWYEKFRSDCWPSDYLIVRGAKCKPPRFYDEKLRKEDPVLFEKIKQSRIENATDCEDNSHRRLLAREKCQQARFKKLIRSFEKDL